MNDEEFLARWSRRKSEASAGKEASPPAELGDARDPAPPAGASTHTPRPEVDLSSLPAIDSIRAATDVTAFLREGVPQELIREALRRAWSADPAIRDFVGLAENAWDFNDPNAMPGFGPLDWSAEQLSAVVERIVGSERSATNSSATAANEKQDHQATASQAVDAELHPPHAAADAPVGEEDGACELPMPPAAAQEEPSRSDGVGQAFLAQRKHGGALPS